MQQEISREEVGLSAQDLPGKKAFSPEEFPAEVYRNCPSLQEVAACLLNGMLARNFPPDMLR